jgi:hypothetical protein
MVRRGEANMTESGVELEPVDLSMSVVGHEIFYTRTVQPAGGSALEGNLGLSVTGATVEHHQHRPVRRVIVQFSDEPSTKLGQLIAPPGEGVLISIFLHVAEFPLLWAALRLDRVAMVDCRIHRPGDEVVRFGVRSEGSLFPLFGV